MWRHTSGYLLSCRASLLFDRYTVIWFDDTRRELLCSYIVGGMQNPHVVTCEHNVYEACISHEPTLLGTVTRLQSAVANTSKWPRNFFFSCDNSQTILAAFVYFWLVSNVSDWLSVSQNVDNEIPSLYCSTCITTYYCFIRLNVQFVFRLNDRLCVIFSVKWHSNTFSLVY